MSLNIGIGGGRRSARSKPSSSGASYKVVNSLAELHIQTVIRPYIYAGEIYQLFSWTEDQKFYLHYNSDGNLYIYTYNTTTDTVAECPVLTAQSVIDNLTSDIHDQPVSAAQAMLLHEMVLQRVTCESVSDLSKVTDTGFYLYSGTMYYCYSVLSTKLYFIKFDKTNGTTIYTYDKIRAVFTETPYLTVNNIANSLTVSMDTSGKVLDARQGKVLSDALTTFQTATDLALFNLNLNKVDKVNGKSLIADTEIERLSKVFNYDDTAIQQLIEELRANKVDKDGRKQLSDENYTAEEKAKLASLGTLVTIKGVLDSIEKLPTINNKVGDVYFVKNKTIDGIDIYAEYVWVNNASNSYSWEMIGTTSGVDLSDYYDKSWIDNTISNLMPKMATTSLATPDRIGFYSYAGDMYFLYDIRNGIKYYYRYSSITGIGLTEYDTNTDTYSSYSYLTANVIVNHLNTPSTEAGKVLDARQGKVLDDRITAVHDELYGMIVDGWGYVTDTSPSARTRNKI